MANLLGAATTIALGKQQQHPAAVTSNERFV
jgi:hypothetical protein